MQPQVALTRHTHYGRIVAERKTKTMNRTMSLFSYEYLLLSLEEQEVFSRGKTNGMRRIM